MKLNVDLSRLHIEVSKMNGLHSLLNELVKLKVSRESGIAYAKEYVRDNSSVSTELLDNKIQLELSGEVGILFKSEEIDALFSYTKINE